MSRRRRHRQPARKLAAAPSAPIREAPRTAASVPATAARWPGQIGRLRLPQTRAGQIAVSLTTVLVVLSAAVLITFSGRVELASPLYATQPANVTSVTTARCPATVAASGQVCQHVSAITVAGKITVAPVTARHLTVGEQIHVQQTSARSWTFASRGDGSAVLDALLVALVLALVLFRGTALRLLVALGLIAVTALWAAAPALLAGHSPVMVLTATAVIAMACGLLATHRVTLRSCTTLLVSVPALVVPALVVGIYGGLEPSDSSYPLLRAHTAQSRVLVALAGELLAVALLAVALPRWMDARVEQRRGIKGFLRECSTLGQTVRSEMLLLGVAWIALALPALLLGASGDAATQAAVATGVVAGPAFPLTAAICSGAIAVVSAVVTRRWMGRQKTGSHRRRLEGLVDLPDVP